MAQYSNVGLMKPMRVSAFYQSLRAFPPGQVRLLEAPWYFEWHFDPFPFWQKVHRQVVFIGFVGNPYGAERFAEYTVTSDALRFRRFVHVLDYVGIRNRGIQFVVFHKDLNREMPPTVYRTAVTIGDWPDYYRRHFGDPYFEDEDLVVFDVTRPRFP